MKNYWEDQTVTTSKRPQAAGDHPNRLVNIEITFKDGSCTTLERVPGDDIEHDIDACENRFALPIDVVSIKELT